MLTRPGEVHAAPLALGVGWGTIRGGYLGEVHAAPLAARVGWAAHAELGEERRERRALGRPIRAKHHQPHLQGRGGEFNRKTQTYPKEEL